MAAVWKWEIWDLMFVAPARQRKLKLKFWNFYQVIFPSWSLSPENFRLVCGQNRENCVCKVGVILLAISIWHRKCWGWQKKLHFQALPQQGNTAIFLSPLHFRCKIEITNKITPTLSTQFSRFWPLTHLKFSGNVEPDQKVMWKKFQKFSFNFLYRAGGMCKRS